MMKIALVTLHYNRQFGIERYVSELAERLASEHEVHVFASSWADTQDEKITFHRIPVFSSKPSLMTLSFLLSVSSRLLRHDFDIVHNHWGGLFVPSITTFHSVHAAFVASQVAAKPETRRRKGLVVGALARMLAFLYGRQALKDSNPGVSDFVALLSYQIAMNNQNRQGIITISEGCKREIQEYYPNVSPDEIEIVPGGVDLRQFSPALRNTYRDAIRAKHHINSDDFVMLFVSHRFGLKNLNIAIEALTYARDKIKLLVVGRDDPGPWTLMANRLRVSDRVIFAGHQKNIQSFYSASDVFVFPVDFAWFDLVTVEAMASGLPLVATRVYGVEEILQHGYNGYFVTKDPREIAQWVETLVSDKNLLAELSANARRTTERFSWEETARKTLVAYERVLEREAKGISC